MSILNQRIVRAQQADTECATLEVQDEFDPSEVILHPISIDASEPVQPGEDIQVEVTVENTSSVSVDGWEIELTINGEVTDSTEVISGSGIVMDSGETFTHDSTELTGTIPTDAAGEEIEVCAILVDASPESDDIYIPDPL